MIISRYLIKEVLQSLIAVTFVLLLVFLSNQLVRYLGYAAAGKIAAHLVFQLLSFEIPYLLTLLLPLGLYLGIILTYGRLNAEHELPVMRASGLSTQQLFTITGKVALGVGILVMLLTLWLNPWLASQKDSLLSQSMATDYVIDTLMPGRFQVSNDGSRVIYVERIARNHKKAQNIFMAEQKNSNSSSASRDWVVLSASEAYQSQDPQTKERYVVASQGFRYEGVPGLNKYKIVQFNHYAVRLQEAEISAHHQKEEVTSSKNLWIHYKKAENAAELQWRLSMPLSVILLTLLALPLSQVKPRQSRYAQLFPAILIYVVYMNLLFVARNWVEEKWVSIGLGMWWVHGVLLVVGLIYLSMTIKFKNNRRLR